jgi:UDP-N-acetylglucosamine 2-epimerase (non-hydrolysing)
LKKKRKILLVAGARPNFMKIAPLYEELRKYKRYKPIIVHTGQHYDKGMSKVFFDDLKMPRPDIYLGIGSGTHAVQTSKIMLQFEGVCIAEKPDLVVVVGDVNSTLACALVASKLNIQIAHVEAGLRSFDRDMPEEINRRLTDHISDLLFTTCVDANRNLQKEGIAKERIYFVGNVMIDTLLQQIKIANTSSVLSALGLLRGSRVSKYAVVTLHRPSNVDEKAKLKRILGVLDRIAEKTPVIFPAHPRTAKQINKFRLRSNLDFRDREIDYDLKKPRVKVLSPLGYHDFLWLMKNAAVVLTDSGGIQEETTILNVPCITIRSNTERPITIKQGTNVLVGNDPQRILKAADTILGKGKRRKRIPKYWDGKAAVRIVAKLNKNLLLD